MEEGAVKVGLCDVDSKIPNVALMKLSSMHKARADRLAPSARAASSATARSRSCRSAAIGSSASSSARSSRARSAAVPVSRS